MYITCHLDEDISNISCLQNSQEINMHEIWSEIYVYYMGEEGENKCNQKHETNHILMDDDKELHEVFYFEELLWANCLWLTWQIWKQSPNILMAQRHVQET